MRAEQLTEVVTYHGEGAGWHPAEQAFKVVDMLDGDLLTLRGDGSVAREHLGTVAAAWRPRAIGGTVVAVERGFSIPEEGWSVEAWSDSGVRMNEGGCDPQGRFYCGSMAYDKRPGAGTLWRLDTDRSVHRVLDGLTISNGLVWSADGRTVFYIDTPTGRIDGYEFDAEHGTLHGRRTIAEVRGGGPDGMTIDADGGLWVAVWGGGAVHRYDASGALTEVVEVAARQVTSCAFGGPGYDRLIITTSREELAEDDDPLAGSIFTVQPGVTGIRLPEYAG
jgi:sugar lactone lactonase YvrE